MSTNKPLKVGDRVTLVGGAWGERDEHRTVTISKGPKKGLYADGYWTDEQGFDWAIWNNPADEFGCVPAVTFKKGDKVRIIEPDLPYPVGTEFIVTDVYSGEYGQEWGGEYGQEWGGYYVTGDNHRKGVWINFIEKVEDTPEPLADWEYELLYGGTPHDEPIFAALLHAYGYPSMGYLISEDSAQYLTKQGPQEGQTWLLTVERGTYAGQMEARVRFDDDRQELVFTFPSAYREDRDDGIEVAALEMGIGWSGRYLRG